MADTSSKKRAAARQITKDDDPDFEEDSAPSDGTFKKASDEVLAKRRIVRVRRAAPASSAPNPFASIQLVAPTVTGLDNAQVEQEVEAPPMSGMDQEKAEDEKSNGKAEVVEADEKPVVENDDKEEDAKPEVEDPEKTAEKQKMTFQQASSGTNAFGSFGSGISSSSFTFGIAAASSTTASSFSFGSSLSSFGSFGSSSSVPAFGTKPADGFSLFPDPEAGSSSPAAAGQQGHATVSLQEVPTETGEEKEKSVFTGDAILYEFVDKAWRERGKGELRLNVSEDENKARLVMRSKGNFRLLLNANLYADILVKKMENKSVTFACLNSAASTPTTLTTYAVKFRDPNLVGSFIGMVDSHKGNKDEGSEKENKAPVAAAPVVEEAAAVAAEPAAVASEKVETTVASGSAGAVASETEEAAASGNGEEGTKGQ